MKNIKLKPHTLIVGLDAFLILKAAVNEVVVDDLEMDGHSMIEISDFDFH